MSGHSKGPRATFEGMEPRLPAMGRKPVRQVQTGKADDGSDAERDDAERITLGHDRAYSDGGSVELESLPKESKHLQDIHTFVEEEGLTPTLYRLPELDAYTFVDSIDPKPVYGNKKMLFLGEDKTNQVWARVKEFPNKPDVVEYIVINVHTGKGRMVRDIRTLPIQLYPFDIAHGKKTENSKHGVTILVRYVFREAGHVDRPFTDNAMRIFKIALNALQRAIDRVGGDPESLINSQTPSKLPEELAHDATQNAPRQAASKTKRTKQTSKPIQAIDAETPSPAPALERGMSRMSLTPAPAFNANGKRSADLGDDARYTEIQKLEAKRAKYANEQARIYRRQEERRRQEEEDERLLAELTRREAAIADQEDRLLEGKSATWLISQQRKFKEEDEG